MPSEPRKRIELDDGVRRQMSIRCVSEEEIEAVVNNPEVSLVVRRGTRPIEGRWRYRGRPTPGRNIEVECQLRADNGLYRIISVREV